MTTPADLLAARVRARGAQPLLTFVDTATDERVELSAVTVDNWVAKTANLFVDGLGLAPGDDVDVSRLPSHWTSAVLALAAWRAGLVVRVGAADDTTGARVVVVGPDGPFDVAADEVLAVSFRALGAPFAEPPGAALDFLSEVRLHGDSFVGPGVSPSAAALVASRRTTWTQSDLVDRAAALASDAGLQASGRLLVSPSTDDVTELLVLTAVPLVTDAAAVLVVGGDDEAAERAATGESVTARVRLRR